MADYKYILEPYKGMKTRFECPSCGMKNRFSRYIDADTGEYVDPSVGRCDREINCGYHKTPKQFFQEHPEISRNILVKPEKPGKTRSFEKKPGKYTCHIPEILEKSRKKPEKNKLFIYQESQFGTEITRTIFEIYRIGTSDHWPGATIFWQIDGLDKIRAGKIILYDHKTGKRVKVPFPHITWVHHTEEIKDFSLKQCFFGEHLLIENPGKPVAIVESEKTAVISSIFYPEMTWLASGNLNGLTLEKCEVLVGKRIFLFPDLRCYDKWQVKAREISGILNSRYSQVTTFHVSDLLEKNAGTSDRENGYDLADYLTGFDRVFVGNDRFNLPPGHTVDACCRDGENWLVQINEHDYPAIWDK